MWTEIDVFRGHAADQVYHPGVPDRGYIAERQVQDGPQVVFELAGCGTFNRQMP